MTINITLPLMGEGVVEAQIGKWLKAVGETVALEEPLVEVETDKVTTEIVAEQAGTLLEILVDEGAMVEVGQVLAVMSGNGKTAVSSPTIRQSLPKPDAPRPTPHVSATPSEATPRPRISPLVSRMAQAHNLDLSLIHGTGKNGRITKHDIQAHLDTQQSPIPNPQSPIPHLQSPITNPHGTLQPHTPMRRRIAEHMVLSKQTSPHATTVFELDFQAVARHRQAQKVDFARRGAKLTYMAYIAAAVIEGLQVVPRVNGRFQDDGIFLHDEINLGIAAAVDNGLVVPVIQQADQLNLFGLAQRITQLAQKARSQQLQPADMQGGTFTITNHGVFGSLFATPIINQPQAGILGVGAIEKRVCVIDDMIAIRPKAYLSFSFDHRLLDGADADRFMQVVKERIEGWG
ncbi:MAG: dihydrolipoamide acetyltransferase family protein [Chloroflexota bacterium]